MKISEKWTQAELDYLKEFYHVYSWDRILADISRTKTGILQKARSLGLRKDFWSTEENEILLNSYESYSMEKIVSLLPHRTRGAIKAQAHRIGVTKHYELNHGFFSSHSLINSNIAGFTAADGYIPLRNRERIYLDRLRINLQERDKHHLEKFKTHTDFTGVVKVSGNGGASKGKNYARIEIMGVQKWLKDLKKNFNVTYNKSSYLPPPNIDDSDLLKCYFIGFLDGDGSIKSNRRLKGKNVSKTLTIEFNGRHEMLSFIKSKLDVWYPTKRLASLSKHAHSISESYRYSLAGNRADLILCDFFRCEVPFLIRKWNKVSERYK